jgi:hypothetical protein
MVKKSPGNGDLITPAGLPVDWLSGLAARTLPMGMICNAIKPGRRVFFHPSTSPQNGENLPYTGIPDKIFLKLRGCFHFSKTDS